MAQTKLDAIKSGNVSNQQALVNQLLPKKAPLKKMVIPGGKSMLDQVGKDRMSQAVYTWLRGCRFFNEVTVSLSSDPSQYRIRETKALDFDTNGRDPIWMTHQDRKRYLAKCIADVLNSQKVVYITAKKEGLYVGVDTEDKFSPDGDDWEPYIEFAPVRTSQYG